MSVKAEIPTLLAQIWAGEAYSYFGLKHNLMVGKLTKPMVRAINQGLVRSVRRSSWSFFGDHIKRTFLVLTPAGEARYHSLNPETKPNVIPVHKREPRAEKRRPRPSDRRRIQAE